MDSQAFANSIRSDCVPSDAEIAFVRSHRLFPEALRAFARGLVVHRQAHRLNWLLDDRSRMIVGYGVLYLHYASKESDEGYALTLSNLQALASQTGVCSPIRMTAIMALMRFSGFVESRDAARRGSRSFIATRKLIDLHRERLQNNFSALALLRPEGAQALEALQKQPCFMPAFVRLMAETFISGFRLLDRAPELRLFAARSGGMMIAAQLLADAEGREQKRTVRIATALLAKRFGLSRSHVAAMLRRAAAEGLLQKSLLNNEEFALLPTFVNAAETFHATLFAYFARCARLALASIASTDQGAGDETARLGAKILP